MGGSLAVLTQVTSRTNTRVASFFESQVRLRGVSLLFSCRIFPCLNLYLKFLDVSIYNLDLFVYYLVS